MTANDSVTNFPNWWKSRGKPVAYLAYLVRGGKQRHRSIFRMGGGGVKVRKIPNFSARFARKVAISNFPRKARGKNENFVCLVDSAF